VYSIFNFLFVGNFVSHFVPSFVMLAFLYAWCMFAGMSSEVVIVSFTNRVRGMLMAP